MTQHPDKLLSPSLGFNNGGPSSGIRKHQVSVNDRCTLKNRTLLNYLACRNWRPYRNCDAAQLARNHSPFLKQLNQMKKLPVHDGCVNTICWNKTGEYILSGSDDCYLCITKPLYLYDTSKDYTVLHKVLTRHLGNIFSAKFIPNSGDTKIASCCSRGLVKVHDIYSSDPGASLLNFNCHSSTVYEVVTVPDEDNLFLTCGDDKTIRLFDMRVHNNCARADTCPHPALIRNSHAMTTLNLNPLNSNLMLVGRADGLGLVYDRRRLPNTAKFSREAAHLERLSGSTNLADTFKYRHPMDGVVAQFQVPELDRSYRFTSLCYNKDGSQVLASYSGEYLYLFNHDSSSNIELVQTLPKESPNHTPHFFEDLSQSSQSQAPSTGAGGRHSTDQSDGAQAQQSPRVSRIRVRGDWSDTGVNSVPHSRLHQTATTNAQTAAAFLEHVAHSLRARIGGNQSGEENNDSPRRAMHMTEIIVGPINYNSSTESNQRRGDLTAQSQSSSDRERSNDDSSELAVAYGDEDEEDEDEEEEREIDECHDRVNEETDGDDEEMLTDYHPDDNQDAAICPSQGVANAGDESSDRMMDSSESNNYYDPVAPTPGQSSSQHNHSRMNPSTKARFNRIVDGLKNRFSQIPTYKPRVKFQGHRNSRTSIKKALFWGDDYVMSGSDCGRIMVWEKDSAKIVMAFQADERVVNCLAPNPHHYVLASSGIDYDVKLWSTQSQLDGPLLVSDKTMSSIVKNNEIMLEESKHTYSVPPHLFFRVLASLARS